MLMSRNPQGFESAGDTIPSGATGHPSNFPVTRSNWS
jgi:hypothetical protein